MKRLGITLLAAALCALCQCTHQKTQVESSSPPLKPEYQPPHMPIATALDDEAEEARREAERRDEVGGGVTGFIIDALFSVATTAIFGSSDEEDRREKRWKKSRKRKILVKKGYIDKDDAPPKGFPVTVRLSSQRTDPHFR